MSARAKTWEELPGSVQRQVIASLKEHAIDAAADMEFAYFSSPEAKRDYYAIEVTGFRAAIAVLRQAGKRAAKKGRR